MDENRGSLLFRRLALDRLWLLCLVLCLTGCTSFLAGHAMKVYPSKIKPAHGYEAANPYQEDFLSLKTLAEEVFSLEERFFPPEKRVPMEQEIFQQFGQPGCTYETFLFGIRRYLAGFNNEHARVVYNPKPIHFTGFYPIRVHYRSNDLVLLDIAREYDSSLIGQKITAINGLPVSEVEQTLFGLVGAENLWTRRAALVSPPFPYNSPDFYRLTGLSSSSSNSLGLEFAGHPLVRVQPKWNGDFQWHAVPPPRHPITTRSSHLYDCRLFPEQNFAYLQFNACFDKTATLDGLSMVRPWLRPLMRAWLGVQFHRKKPATVLNGAYDPERPVLKDYLASAIQDINRQGITNLIIDLRNNGGGETELCYQLLYHLTRREDLRDAKTFQYNPEVFAFYHPEEGRAFRSWYRNKFGAEPPGKQLSPTPERPFFDAVTDPASPYYVVPDRPVFDGRIIVLANENTQSAASALAALMQDNRLARIIGTTTANNPTRPSSMSLFKLPRSGILISLPIQYFERSSPEKGDVFQPDDWVENSAADIQNGRDAAFEKALNRLPLRD